MPYMLQEYINMPYMLQEQLTFNNSNGHNLNMNSFTFLQYIQIKK